MVFMSKFSPELRALLARKYVWKQQTSSRLIQLDAVVVLCTLNIVLRSQTYSEIKDLYRLLLLCQRAIPEKMRAIAQVKFDAYDNPVVF
jgi:hypothetical protein